MRQRSFGFEPAAIQATNSSREPTGGLGALSSRVDIRRLILTVQAWAPGEAGVWPTLVMEKPARAQALARRALSANRRAWHSRVRERQPLPYPRAGCADRATGAG